VTHAASSPAISGLPGLSSTTSDEAEGRSEDDAARAARHPYELLCTPQAVHAAPEANVGNGPDDPEGGVDFDYAEWVGRRDIRKFEKYARRRQTHHDEYYDVGRMRRRDVEFIYKVGIKGPLSPYLDTSETFTADVLGELIEHVDGLTRVLRTIDEAFFTNNIFRPSNPFKKFGNGIGGDHPPGRDPEPCRIAKLSSPTWKWKGDIHVRLPTMLEDPALAVDEITLNVGRLKLSDDVEIRFDLFYLYD